MKKLTTPELLLGIDTVKKKRKTSPVERKVFDSKLIKAAERLCANLQQVKTKMDANQEVIEYVDRGDTYIYNGSVGVVLKDIVKKDLD